jgi:hypothetical protein
VILHQQMAGEVVGFGEDGERNIETSAHWFFLCI